MDNVVIIGAGNLGIACAYKYLKKYYDVTLFTSKVQGETRISMTDIDGDGESIAIQATNSEEVFENADLILICGPGFMYNKWMRLVKETDNRKVLVCSVIGSNGFLEACNEAHFDLERVGVFQRVPYICRSHYNSEIGEYECTITGHKKEHRLMLGDDFKISVLQPILEDADIRLLDNPIAVDVSNSNPLLHTARLMEIGMKKYQHHVKFYSEWGEDAAYTYLMMDAELMALRDKLKVNPKDMPDVLTYYAVERTGHIIDDSLRLRDKLRSLKALEGIDAPMINISEDPENPVFVLDVNSRYFREDFVIGLRNAINRCRQYCVPCPTMEKVFEWGLLQIVNHYYGTDI